ncbi:MAG: hypothetical protein ACYTET_05065 [Planctomycetota bacterium]|jgi:hypothetical protein
MINPLPIIAETSAPGPFSPLVLEALVVTICTLGLAILIIWLFFRGGPTVLKNAPARRNRMLPFLPLAIVGIWVFAVALISQGINMLFADSSDAEREMITYPALAVLELVLITAMLIIAHLSFARGLKGFGLNLKTTGKDTGWALVNLTAAYPLVMAGLFIVQLAGQWITQNPDFSVETHQSLAHS